jgi:hypothetical protein
MLARFHVNDSPRSTPLQVGILGAVGLVRFVTRSADPGFRTGTTHRRECGSRQDYRGIAASGPGPVTLKDKEKPKEDTTALRQASKRTQPFNTKQAKSV